MKQETFQLTELVGMYRGARAWLQINKSSRDNQPGEVGEGQLVTIKEAGPARLRDISE